MRTTVFSRSPSCPPPAGRARPRRVLAASTSRASVKGFIAFVAPYKPDIVQGNVVTTEQIAQVKPGMTRAQVRDILGSPLITDPFHGDRWDYVFTLRRQGFDDQQRSFVVLFEKDAVLKIDAPTLPSEDEFVASISRKKLPTTTPKLELTDAEQRGAAGARRGRRAGRLRRRAGGRHAHLPAAGIRRRRERRPTPAAPLRIAIAGASGRMGRMLIEAVLDAPDCALAGALDVAGNPQLGQDAGAFLGRATGVAITDDLRRRARRQPGADRLHAPRRHAAPPRGLRRARRRRWSSAPPASAPSRRPRSAPPRSARRSSCRPT